MGRGFDERWAAAHPIQGCNLICLRHGFNKRSIQGREVIEEIWYLSPSVLAPVIIIPMLTDYNIM